MTWFRQAAGIIGTIARKVRLRDVMLVTQDNGILKVRNDADTDYADIDVKRLLIEGQVPAEPLSDAQGRIWLWHHYATVIAGNAMRLNMDPSQFGNGTSDQNTSAAGDTFEHQNIYLTAGTYTIRMSYQRGSVMGQLTVVLKSPGQADIPVVAGLEMYNAASIYNNIATWSGIVVPVTGVWALRGSVPTKNASSAAFFARLTWFDVVRTGD